MKKIEITGGKGGRKLFQKNYRYPKYELVTACRRFSQSIWQIETLTIMKNRPPNRTAIFK
jgi:hypothetical protein